MENSNILHPQNFIDYLALNLEKIMYFIVTWA